MAVAALQVDLHALVPDAATLQVLLVVVVINLVAARAVLRLRLAIAWTLVQRRPFPAAPSRRPASAVSAMLQSLAVMS